MFSLQRAVRRAGELAHWIVLPLHVLLTVERPKGVLCNLKLDVQPWLGALPVTGLPGRWLASPLAFVDLLPLDVLICFWKRCSPQAVHTLVGDANLLVR